MADKKISALDPASALLDSDELVLASGGGNKKISGVVLKSAFQGVPGPPGPEGPAGEQGPTGPPGPASGAAGGVSWSTTVGDGTSTAFILTHGIGTRAVQVSVYRSDPPYDSVEAEIEHTDLNTTTVRFQSPPSSAEFTVAINGPGLGAADMGGDKNYVHNQAALASTWSVVHGLNKYPSVAVVDTGDNEVIPNLHYVSVNEVTLTFAGATSGKAYVN